MSNLVTLRHLVWACVNVRHYRVSLCVNAVLTSCRPESVRLSVTLVYCSQTIKGIVESSSLPARAIILLPEAIRCYPIPRRIPSAWVLNTKCVWKICTFRLKSPFIAETVRDRSMVAIERQYEIIVSRSIGVGSDYLEWSWKLGREGSNFRAGLVNNARAIWPRMTNFGR